ncbi:ACP S-malonyltransferase [[Clostridium] colinum]|uniref:ACP S-malonyltransferase n=1 Tax=[Clostridium] colinum TaxID=36835 RepID=UPI0020246932|nr:ACP S-malonyltransferase [[Clostridium] colinum]
MKICFIFSGQGAQYNGMGKELYDNFSVCKQVFEDANNALGFNITDICFNEDEKLNQTEYTQPAILTTSYAIFKLMEEKGVKADYMAGLSLGEYSALCASGAISFKEGVALVRKRGKYMTEAVPVGVGAMSAVMNADENIINEALKEASTDTELAMIANYNAPGQIVIAGHTPAIERAEIILKEKGIKKVIRLNVSGPFHTSLLKPASDKLATELENISINTPSIDVFTNLTGEKIENIKDTLIQQVMSPVKWEQTIKNLINLGVDTFIELGPGKTLSSFVKKVSKEVNVYNVEDLSSLEKTCKGIGIE